MCEGVKSVGGARFSGIKKIMLKRSCLKSKKLRKDNCKMKMMKRPKKMALKLAGIMMLLMLCMPPFRGPPIRPMAFPSL